VKIFPVSAMGGPSYIKALLAPLPEVPLMPSGGVSIEDIPAYRAAGAAAVGISSPLLGDLSTVELQVVADRARRATELAAAPW
jgi:2-dehydro-3-deoxyphosphogluconate aldolase/(4S)-4-hydroxy-2-oxoglutarate aldolase